MTAAWIGALPVFFQWFFLFVSPLRHKYEYFSQLASPVPYREAVRARRTVVDHADDVGHGLFTAMKWRFIFPDLRDYRVLGALPLRPRHVFGAKLVARSPSPPPPWSL